MRITDHSDMRSAVECKALNQTNTFYEDLLQLYNYVHLAIRYYETICVEHLLMFYLRTPYLIIELYRMLILHDSVQSISLFILMCGRIVEE